MAMAALSADKDIGGDVRTPPSSGSSSSEGSDFVILQRPSEGPILGSPNDFQVKALATPFANGAGEVSTMMNADHLMSAFNGLKQENALLKGQLNEMNKAMQSRVVEMQTMRDDQNRMSQDLKDKHQKAKKAIAHHLEQNKNLSERLKDLLEKDNQSTRKVEGLQREISQLQMELRKSQAAALSRPPTVNSDAPSSAPSSLLVQMQEDLKNAQETRAEFKRELQQMEEAEKQSGEALQKVNETELQRLQQAAKRKDEEKQDLLKMFQELQQKYDNLEQSVAGSLQESDEPRPQNSRSLPSGQSDGEHTDEEQGYSLMHDSKDFTGAQGFGQDILKQLQIERERSDKVSAELKEERSSATELKARVTKLEADLQAANHQLMKRSETYKEEVSTIHQKHKAEVDDLVKRIDELSVASQASQEERYDSGVQLKHQVKSLVAELNTKEQDIQDRDHTIDNLHAEIAALRNKLEMYHDDLDKERDQSSELVNTLQQELHRLKGELQQKDTMLNGQKQKALHSQLEFDRLKEEYDQLFGDYDNLTRNFESMRSNFEKVQPMLAKQQEMMANQDSLLARLISAEEAIKAKDEQNEQLKGEMKQMKTDLETVPVLRAQAEVYKSDFDAERAAREKAHADKEVLLNELETLKAEYEQIQQEAANQAQPRVLDLQRRHGGDTGGGLQRGENEYGMNQGPMDAWGAYQYGGDNNADFYNHGQAHGQAGANIEGGQAADRNMTCPKCMDQFPDMDTLQIHMLECIQ